MRRFIPILILLLAFASMAGCQPYRAGRIDPNAGLPQQPGVTTPVSSDNPSDTADTIEDLYGHTDRWWEAFGDEGLNSLVEDALFNNLEIKGATERTLQAKELARQAGASRLPGVSVGFQAGRARQQSPVGPITTNSFSLSATASYELDIWGKLGSRARASVYEAEATKERLKAQFMNISAEAAEHYFTVIQQNEQLALSGLTIDSLGRILQSVELRYKKGLVSSLDVYQARQNLAESSTEKPGFEMDRQASLLALAMIMGQAPEGAPAIEAALLPDPPPFPEEMPSGLLERRPDVQTALHALKASDERVAAAVSDRFPSFNLSLAYGGASSQMDSILDSPNIFWNLLMQTALPIFDAGRRRSEVRRSESVLRERISAYHGAVLNALREVNVALIKNKKSGEQVRLNGFAVMAGENTLRVAGDQYLQGLTDYMNLLSAQQQLYRARKRLVLAKRGLISARIELARALGGTWMDEELNNISIKEAENEEGL